MQADRPALSGDAAQVSLGSRRRFQSITKSTVAPLPYRGEFGAAERIRNAAAFFPIKEGPGEKPPGVGPAATGRPVYPALS